MPHPTAILSGHLFLPVRIKVIPHRAYTSMHSKYLTIYRQFLPGKKNLFQWLILQMTKKIIMIAIYRHLIITISGKQPLKRVASPNGAAGWSQPQKVSSSEIVGGTRPVLMLTGWWWWWWWCAFQSLPGNSWKLGHWLYFKLRSDTASTRIHSTCFTVESVQTSG